MLKEKIKCVRERKTCEGENKGFRWKMKSTSAEEKMQRLR